MIGKAEIRRIFMGLFVDLKIDFQEKLKHSQEQLIEKEKES